MKKDILTVPLLIGILFLSCSANAEMETKSLSIGGDSEDSESSIQSILKSETKTPEQPAQIAPAEINNYIDATPPYNYYPYPANYYTRTIGPYGLYTNIGSFSFNYTGHGYNYGLGTNRHVYVNHPAPPPPPHHHPNGHRPPNGGGGGHHSHGGCRPR